MKKILSYSPSLSKRLLSEVYMLKNSLWCDLTTDADRIAFVECGRAWETGIIAQAMVPEFVALLKLAAAARTHIERLAESDDRADWHESGINLEIALGDCDNAFRR
jgi:hypothetical protein